MKTILLGAATWAVFAATLLSVDVVRADLEGDKSKDATSWPAELLLVKQSLEPILEKLEPKATIEYRDKSLLITYRPQTFQVHRENPKSGEFDAKAHSEIGPSSKGIVLRASLQPLGEVNQAVTPQTFKLPYWSTYLDVTPIRKSDKQLHWTLSYGSQTDKQLREKIHQKLLELAE